MARLELASHLAFSLIIFCYIPILNSKYHIIISIFTGSFFAFLLLRGYKNRDLNHNLSKFFVGVIAGTVNGFGTLAGLPIALYFLIIAAEPAVIRASLAALFFFTDAYALVLGYFNDIINLKVFYRSIPLFFIIHLEEYLITTL